MNNLNGIFDIEGINSSLKTESLLIIGNKINGEYSIENNLNDISVLNVFDDNVAYIKSDDTEMYAKVAKYNKKTSLIELEESVKIIREEETILGDYGTLDTENNSYKIGSNSNNKVKIVITENND